MSEDRYFTDIYKIKHRAERLHSGLLVPTSGSRGRQMEPSSSSFEKQETGVAELPAAG